MRAIVAFDVPRFEPLKPTWLRPESHVTLHFFEELQDERIPVVVEAIVEATRGIPPFEVEIRGVGAFPSIQHPRVIWAGLGEGFGAVISLEDRLEKVLSSRGFGFEHRQFVPHLTLARIRNARTATHIHHFLSDPENVGRTWARTRVTSLDLKESELLPSGARHTTRRTVSLEPPP